MVKIVALALTLGIIIIYLKSTNSELYVLAVIGSGIVLLYSALEYFLVTYKFFSDILSKTGASREFFSILLKIVAIGYLTEFAAGTLRDSGLTGLSDKLIFIGKIIILGVSMPIIYAVFNLVTGLLS